MNEKQDIAGRSLIFCFSEFDYEFTDAFSRVSMPPMRTHLIHSPDKHDRTGAMRDCTRSKRLLAAADFRIKRAFQRTLPACEPINADAGDPQDPRRSNFVNLGLHS